MDAEKSEPASLEDAARKGTGLLGEYVAFLRHTKKWWLIPILVAVAALGLLTILAATGAAPFIYTLF